MYFDPGTGSMLIQMLLALLASAGVFLFAFKNKLMMLFHKKKNVDTEETAEEMVKAEHDNEEN